MNEFEKLESHLRDMPLREPSDGLDERVLSLRRLAPVSRGVPWWLAAAASFVMGAAGFLMGAAWPGEPTASPLAPAPTIQVQVIYDSPGAQNPFDFTEAAHDFNGGEWETSVTTGGGETI